MKKYLTQIETKNGAVVYIKVCTYRPYKPYGVWYCGSGTGQNYATLGHACKYIESVAKKWTDNNIEYETTYKTRKEFEKTLSEEQYKTLHY